MLFWKLFCVEWNFELSDENKWCFINSPQNMTMLAKFLKTFSFALKPFNSSSSIHHTHFVFSTFVRYVLMKWSLFSSKGTFNWTEKQIFNNFIQKAKREKSHFWNIMRKVSKVFIPIFVNRLKISYENSFLMFLLVWTGNLELNDNISTKVTCIDLISIPSTNLMIHRTFLKERGWLWTTPTAVSYERRYFLYDCEISQILILMLTTLIVSSHLIYGKISFLLCHTHILSIEGEENNNEIKEISNENKSAESEIFFSLFFWLKFFVIQFSWQKKRYNYPTTD